MKHVRKECQKIEQNVLKLQINFIFIVYKQKKMSEKLLVPDIGDFENVEVIELLVKEGQEIERNGPVVTIESDKSSVEIPSTVSGKIEKIELKVGDKVSKGDLILNYSSSSNSLPESSLPKDTENIIKQAEEAIANKKDEEINLSLIHI